jgi:hypothetical protein
LYIYNVNEKETNPNRSEPMSKPVNRKERNQGMNWIRKDLRLAISLRDGMACMWCGRTLEDGAQMSLDHIIPHSLGGKNGADNLVCSCSKCNSSRGNRDAEEFAYAVAEYLDHGITGKQIIAAIREHLETPIKSYRDEAKRIIARRPSWQKALKTASRMQ